MPIALSSIAMLSWKKLGRIFVPQDVPGRYWLKDFAQAPCALVLETVVRVYFSCRPMPDAQGNYVSYTGYVDFDRHDLSTIVAVSANPILPLGKLGTFDEFGIYPVSVVKSDSDVLAYYGGWTRCESIPFTVSIGLAISRDNGATFQRQGKGPLITSNVNDPFVVSGPKIRRFDDHWYLWYVAGTKWHVHDGRAEAVYKIRLATSEDGYCWHRSGANQITDKLEVDECQASPDVFKFQGRYHMFFCYKYGVDFRNSQRGYRIGYAVSDDLFNWTRDDSKAGIDVSSEGWDSESVSYPNVFEVDGKIYMLYLGNEFGKYGFGLAQLTSVAEQ